MVVVTPAAEEPLASTPRRGMDCVGKANSNKKLVQARLPFKRLNPEPKECSDTKRTKRPFAPKCPEPSGSDGENDLDCSSIPHHGPALVNGRGPLDSFMSRKRSPARSTPEVTIDLTEDSNDAIKQQPAPPVSTTCPLTEQITHNKEVSSQNTEAPTALTEKEDSEMEEAEELDTLSLLDITQDSETEEEEEEEQPEAEVSKKNESVLSIESTSSISVTESSPEPSKSAPSTPSSINVSNKVKRRSLKNVQEQEEKQRRREEKERLKMEAKEAKEKKKEEARRLREEKEREKKEKKEKEEKEKRDKKEREEKEKAEKLKAKEEQRQMKIEAKLEEKRKKDEEKRLKEEKDRIKAEKAEITRFLQKPKTQLAPKTLASACGKFAPFEIKAHMALAPLTRVQCEDAVLDDLDRYLDKPDSTLNGLKDWTSHKPRRSGPTMPSLFSKGDCVVLTDCQKADAIPDRGRMKLLQFHDNYRPAYWGTCSKKSTRISPRCPLKLDKNLLDYEVDSDEEWEEEEPGESLSHSEGDDDDEAGDDDDDDDGFFVPHGYLSEGEGALEEEEGGDPEKQKLHQRLKAREWEKELMSKGKVKVLEAVVHGCLWETEELALELLQPYAVCMLEPLPKDETGTPEQDVSQQQRNEKFLSLLLPLLHGNVNSSKIIINEFLAFCHRQQTSSSSESPLNSTGSIPSRIQVRRIIKENAVYAKRSSYKRCCWYVHPEVLARHSLEALPVPCQWIYLTSGAQATRDDPAGSQGNSPTASSSTTPSNKRKSASSHSITKYMKKCEPGEQTAMETDGFQADTEEDEDDECIIIGEQSGLSEPEANLSTAQTERNTEAMDTTETAALTLPCPTLATA